MNNAPLPLTHDIVLIGGGHTHALVLRKWGMDPLPGARLTLINPGPTAPYSGMLPGYVAGHYDRADLDIDLVKLARFAGARLVLGAADGIDLMHRQVRVPGRPPIAFDICSIDIGITSDMPRLPGFDDFAVPAKPLGPFAARWGAFLDQPGPADVAIIGAGVAGAELAMAMAHALTQRGRTGTVSLIDSADALSATGPIAQARIRENLDRLGVVLFENAPIEAVHADHIALQDGRTIASLFTTGTAGARPYDWIADTGLTLTDGFVSVGATLQASDPSVFAVGDCAHLTHDPRPKAGVYAVRQAPVLFDNLRALATEHDLGTYHPQRDYLKLISLGSKSAVAERFGRTFSGPLMWRWKDHIDQKFMTQFRTFPTMESPALPPIHTIGMAQAMGDKPLCGGCGAKVGRTILRGVLGSLPDATRDDITMLPGDDAALLHTGGVRQVLTSDHLRALVADPVVMTRIAAIHALGDIWAMGATPQAATATLILPRQSDVLQARQLREIMSTAHETMHHAGATIVGGHTSLGDELTIGFTITGLCKSDPITLAGGLVGDALILTKPVGSGVLMAAEMAGLADGAWIEAALATMMQSQSDAAQILSDAHAMTDVTGFGLIGHLLGLCEASGTGAELDLAAIPVMQGALDLATQGVRSTIFADNRALAPDLPDSDKADLLFDPQTAGGLLAAVDCSQANDLVSALRAKGYDAARIGTLTKDTPDIKLANS